MEIQWALVIFTALTGTAGWMFACVATDEFLGRAKAAAFPASVIALVAAIVGGCASVTHLSHPENIMGALSHPTSGIFVEAMLTGCLCVCIAAYLVLKKRGASAAACKVLAVLGAVFGVVLSFMAGESYLMGSRPNWDTQLLPIGYMLTAVPVGVSAYLLVVAAKDGRASDVEGAAAQDDPYALGAWVLIVAGALGAIGSIAYLASAGAFGSASGMCVLALAGCGIAPIVCGIVLRMRKGAALGVSVVSLACALIGAVAFRCAMWMITVPVADLFGIVL